MTNDNSPHREAGAVPGATSARENDQGNAPVTLPRPRHTRAIPLQRGAHLDPDVVEVIESAGARDPWWRDGVDRAISDLALTGRPFTADDLRPLGIAEPEIPQQWGAPFLAAARAGIIRAVGATVSTRRARHGGLQRQWIGTEQYRRARRDQAGQADQGALVEQAGQGEQDGQQ